MSSDEELPLSLSSLRLLYAEGSAAEILSEIPLLPLPAASNNNELIKTNIVIVGGSIGGLATAACLKAVGFQNLTIVEKNQKRLSGAGIGLDDVSVSILKSLGVELAVNNDTVTKDGNKFVVSVQRMRYTEERLFDGTVMIRQPYPYSAVLYAELVKGLEHAARANNNNNSIIQYGKKATKIQRDPKNDKVTKLYFDDGSSMDCDMVVFADGPRSSFRQEFLFTKNGDTVTSSDDDLRFAGYTAWRGTVKEADLPSHVMKALKEEYPHYSNCLYFISGPSSQSSSASSSGKNNGKSDSDSEYHIGQSAVLYDIGNGLLNWLIYETCDSPKAPPGRTTTTATDDDIMNLKNRVKKIWGDALGSVMACTPEPFQNDIYDIKTPLQQFFRHNTCILGDAAHPITPHCAKGSNLAIHDAYILAHCASKVSCISDMLQLYSKIRSDECARTVLLSRHLGRLRNGMTLSSSSSAAAEGTFKIPNPHPTSSESFESCILNFGLPTATLPLNSHFEPLWEFMEKYIPKEQRGFCLHRTAASISPPPPPPPLDLVAINHISRETHNVGRLVKFYKQVLGLQQIDRPDFGFGGAWFRLPVGNNNNNNNNMALHIIESDPTKPKNSVNHIDKTTSNNDTSKSDNIPERYIRRSEHIAFTVADIEIAKQTLKSHDINFAINYVPGTKIEQLFFYDPDGNGIEIGNFDIIIF